MPSRLIRPSLFTLGLALAGCNMAPKYVRPDLPVLPAQPLVDAGSATSEQRPVAWRSFFTDERLRRLIDLSLDNNRDLRIAIANVAQARAQYRTQRADLLPTLAAGGTVTYQRTPPGLSGVSGGSVAGSSSTRLDIYQAQVGVSAWEIDLFGRVRNLTTAAQEQFFASDANRQAARVSLIAQVADAWLTLAADQERLGVVRDTASAYRQTLDIITGRAREGIASDLDIRQAQTSYDQARADVASLTTAVAQDRNALDLLAGASIPVDLLPTRVDGNATIAALPAGLSSQVLLQRPDVAAAEHQLRAANADIGAARAAFFPNISLTAAFGTLSLGLSNLFGHGSQNWSVAPTASLPIFDYGRNKGNLRYAEATRDAMVATYEKNVQTAFREVADALARRSTIDEQLEAEQSLESAASAAYRIAKTRYDEGVDPFLTTLDSQRSYYTARQSLVAIRLEKQANAVELYRALGGGID